MRSTKSTIQNDNNKLSFHNYKQKLKTNQLK